MWTRNRSKIGIVTIEATVPHGVDGIHLRHRASLGHQFLLMAVAGGSSSSRRDDRAVSERHAEQDE
jgi:hypothetical protein